MADVLMAFKPKWAMLILDGRKTVDCRRVMPKRLQVGDKVWMYCQGYILGHFLVRDVEVFDGKDEWQMDAIIDTFAEDARLSEDELRAYWAGARRPGLIFVKGATPNAYPVRWEGVGHPKNFIYLKGAEQGWVGTEVPCSEEGKEEQR